MDCEPEKFDYASRGRVEDPLLQIAERRISSWHSEWWRCLAGFNFKFADALWQTEF
jgi:hypothetical protein